MQFKKRLLIILSMPMIRIPIAAKRGGGGGRVFYSARRRSTGSASMIERLV